MPNQSVWTLRETLIVAVLGAVFGVLYLGWVQVWLVLQARWSRSARRTTFSPILRVFSWQNSSATKS